jgi:hypothetical protein
VFLVFFQHEKIKISEKYKTKRNHIIEGNPGLYPREKIKPTTFEKAIKDIAGIIIDLVLEIRNPFMSYLSTFSNIPDIIKNKGM